MYTSFIFAVCNADLGLERDTSDEYTCVCAVGYYQTVAATADAPVECSACAVGSTTNGDTNSQDITACGKNF